MINNFGYVVTKSIWYFDSPVSIVSSEKDAWTFIEISLNKLYNKFLKYSYFIQIFIDIQYKRVYCGFYDISDNKIFDTTFSIVKCPKYGF